MIPFQKKISIIALGGMHMKIENEYAVQMLIEVLYEKELINRATYLNIMKQINQEQQRKVA